MYSVLGCGFWLKKATAPEYSGAVVPKSMATSESEV
jgi:hypothetical protein